MTCRMAARAGALQVIGGVARRCMIAPAAAVAVLGALVLSAALALPRPAAARTVPITGVNVFPIPNAQVASPHSQITFRGIAWPELEAASISVVGSVTGAHTGHLAADSDGRGGSFLLDHPFTPGEVVTVHTSLPIYGTKGSGPAGFGTSWSFTVANPAGGFPDLHWPPAARVAGDAQSFHSRPDLQPVSVSITHPGAGDSGDIFLAPQYGPVQDGPMILDPQGNLIWFDALPGNESASDFSVQSYQGHPVLTWWQGYMAAGVGVGEDVIFNQAYQQIATVKAANGLDADLHEFELTSHGDALITAEYPVFWNDGAKSPGRHVVIDSVVQEIDIATGLVLFQWDSLDHVPLADSYVPLPLKAGHPYDPYHVNSVQLDGDGNLIISARNTWAAYKVSIRNGNVIWALGGKNSSFRLSPGTYWAFQHDVRVHAQGDRYVTIFDDEGGPPQIRSQSRAIKLELDTSNWTAHQVAVHEHAPSLQADYEGNYQQLSDGDDFIGWGEAPYFTEYDPQGQVAFDGHMLGANASYRVYRFPWSATPWNAPAVAATTSGSHTTVWASWNGATGVVYWRVLGGSTATTLHEIGAAARTGFETAVNVPRSGYVEVEALDGAHHVLASSPPVAVR